MSWILLSLLAGFGQALVAVTQKKVLAYASVSHTLGCVSYIVAGIALFFVWKVKSDNGIPLITTRFIISGGVVIITNIIGVWAIYRALHTADISKLMPFMACSSLTLIPIEYILRDIYPNVLQMWGIGLVVLGAVIFGIRQGPGDTPRQALYFFLITITSYSIGSPYMGVMVEEVHDGLFAGIVAHTGVGIGFIPLVLYAKEHRVVRTAYRAGVGVPMLLYIILSGVIIALLENGPINIALETASVGEVFALKRTMPIFALILGVLIFRETIARKHIIGTLCIVAGSMSVAYFR